jgi:hypothetical protein
MGCMIDRASIGGFGCGGPVVAGLSPPKKEPIGDGRLERVALHELKARSRERVGADKSVAVVDLGERQWTGRSPMERWSHRGSNSLVDSGSCVPAPAALPSHTVSTLRSSCSPLATDILESGPVKTALSPSKRWRSVRPERTP